MSDKAKIGRKATITISVANTTELRISLEPWKISDTSGSLLLVRARSRRRRRMFSTSMIESSTTSPIANTRPPSVSALMPAPRNHSTRMPVISDSGIAIRLISVACQRARNRNSTSITMIEECSSTSCRLSTDRSMKLA